jgi:putative oxidoreductase
MSLSRRVARPFLAAPFVAEGLDTLRDPAPHLKVSEDVARRIAARVGWPKDPEALIKLNAGVQVGAGAMLAIGKFRRLSALLLIGSTIPTTYAEHRFWEIEDPEERSRQQALFIKSLGLLGGLILELIDTQGAPSLGWRARRAVRRVGDAVPLSGDSGRPSQVADWVSHNAGGAASAVGTGAQAGLTAGSRALATARGRSLEAGRAVGSSSTAASAKKVSRRAARNARQLVAAAAERGDDLWAAQGPRAVDALNAGSRQVGQLLEAGSERAGSLLATGAKQADEAIHGVIQRLPIS